MKAGRLLQVSNMILRAERVLYALYQNKAVPFIFLDIYVKVELGCALTLSTWLCMLFAA